MTACLQKGIILSKAAMSHAQVVKEKANDKIFCIPLSPMVSLAIIGMSRLSSTPFHKERAESIRLKTLPIKRQKA